MLILILAVGVSCEKRPADRPSGMPGGPDKGFSLIEYVNQEGCGELLSTPLYAGRDIEVGVLEVSSSMENYIDVKYKINEGSGWTITETHLSVTESLDEVPGYGKNPIPGLFKYKDEHENELVVEYNSIPVGEADHVFVLAHAVVARVCDQEGGLDESLADMPESAQMYVYYPGELRQSYFTTTVLNGGILDGDYKGWCIDADAGINFNNEFTYDVKVLSSYDTELPAMNLVDKPENMDLVNWIINQDYTGQVAFDDETFTFGDVQRAIWVLLEDDPGSGTGQGLDNWSEQRVKLILSDALRGEGFVPSCDEDIAIILIPIDPDTGERIPKQTTIVEFPVECTPVYCDETAWAAGMDFGGNNWAMFFEYCIK